MNEVCSLRDLCGEFDIYGLNGDCVSCPRRSVPHQVVGIPQLSWRSLLASPSYVVSWFFFYAASLFPTSSVSSFADEWSASKAGHSRVRSAGNKVWWAYELDIGREL